MELVDRDAGIDLAELLAAFSLATDLGLGQARRRSAARISRSGVVVSTSSRSRTNGASSFALIISHIGPTRLASVGAGEGLRAEPR